ncbi:DEAD/DEAH box helicase [Parvularcula flava]|uniref:DEAD/DEAH box helicase n=1 Tax=Aquisalinus luteolus TaxID=1566827 RepID=A0A8J3A270_9PROT|nr:DEAD/DEAH box helicase [Aquisalinus luteolus]NHK27924.1 DEAD/DEAH box helicase [Aquisalinus luteolus]GGH96939.1 DEAD/DEAH box helicase [Aquisalinus luteolus]
MGLEVIQEWLVGPDGIKEELDRLRLWSAALSFGPDTIRHDNLTSEHDWKRLLFAASILAQSEDREAQEYALMVAEAAICFSEDRIFQDAGGLILTRLSNHRAVQLAQEREFLKPNLESRTGTIEQLLLTRRRLQSEILLNENDSILGNRFQNELWSSLATSHWLSATAPTAAGKTYAVLNWLLLQHATGKAKSSVFVAPTRALVSEVEHQLNQLKLNHELNKLTITSLPINEIDSDDKPFIAVFTQERLHIFLNAKPQPHPFDIAIIDEAQKLSDERRGVILQDAIERVTRANEQCRLIFLSPHSENPDVLLEEAPSGVTTAVVPSNTATVMQNVMVAEQVRGNTKEWTLSLSTNDGFKPLGGFSLFDRPTSVRKRMAFVALALGKETSGTLIYVTTADSAERVAGLIYDGLADEEISDDEELNDLSEFCDKIIHPKFQLVHLVKRGVAFHYGNMPSLLREEIERLFTAGKIRFLVSTSTLIEGVNLACRTIIIRGPKKGIGRDMSPQDFWNLAGRAGRWGADFYGNIVCVDVSKPAVWPQGLPNKTAYPIRRETDQVIEQFDDLSEYLSQRTEMKTEAVNGKLEHVAAYLMSWQYREGSLRNAPPVKKLSEDRANQLEELIKPSLEAIEISQEIVDANPGISIVALQRLLTYFRDFSADPKLLLPIPPEDEESVNRFVFIFDVINLTLAPVFAPEQRVLPCALTTWDWMRGKTLGQMIKARLKRERAKPEYQSDEELPYAKFIRDTMAAVEEIARFLAPKYLGAYLSVLRQNFHERGISEEFPDDLTYDLFLEFGVSTRTLITLISLGLSRTSSIELSDYLGRTDLNEIEVLQRLERGEWESLDLPALVKREIRRVIEQKKLENSADSNMEQN